MAMEQWKVEEEEEESVQPRPILRCLFFYVCALRNWPELPGKGAAFGEIGCLRASDLASAMKRPVADGAAADAPADERSTAPHVLVIPYPARGHNLAAIQLARKLVRHGVRITMADIFRNLSQDLLEICKAEEIQVINLGLRPAYHGPSNLPYLGDVESVQGETEQLLASLQSPAVTCILSDVFLGWTQSVADKFGLPRYVLCASPAKVLAVLLYMPELAAQGVVPVELSRGAEVVRIPGLLPTRKADLSPAVQTKFGLQFFEQYVHRCCQPAVESAAGFFVNSFEDLEPSCIDALRSDPYNQRAHSKGHTPRSVFPVGPLVHDTFLQPLRSTTAPQTVPPFVNAEAPYLQWLNNHPPRSVLYVNFGSVVSVSVRQIHALKLGLKASNQPFLLVVRPAKAGDDSATECSTALPERFTGGAVGERLGFVQLEWVEQVDVLAHPAVGGFLTHCGWNSTLESVCRGVPLLAWPFQADQKLNCRFLVDEAHAAIEVLRGPDGAFVSAEEVARAVRALMAEPAGEIVRVNVRKLQDKVKRAISEEGSVQRSIRAFLAELIENSAPLPAFPLG